MKLRVVHSGPGEAAANMEYDLRLAREVGAEPNHAVLRWYTWEPPAFSLGYGQKPETVLDLERVAELRVQYAKRPTGGSLVYHENDQSYSLTLPRENPFGIETSRDLYRFVSEAWVEGLALLGITAGIPAETPKVREVPELARRLCLAFASPGDVLVDGRKIGGSAQRRFREVWLQEGFFMLRPAEVPDCFTDPSTRAMMKGSSRDLTGLGHAVEAAALREALSRALESRVED
jgi:lipoate-protein ligase A